MAKQDRRQYSDEIIKQQIESNKINAETLRILKEQNAALKEQTEEKRKADTLDKGRAQSEEEINASIDKSVQLTKLLSGFTRDDLSNRLKRKKLDKLQNEALEEQQKLLTKVDKLGKSNNKYQKNAAKILKDQADSIGESLKQAELLGRELNNFDKSGKIFDKMASIIKDIPVLSKIFTGFSKMSKEADEVYKKTGSTTKARIAGVKAGLKGGLEVLLAALIGGLVKGLGKIDEAAVELQRTLNLSRDTAEAYGLSLMDISKTELAVTFGQIRAAAQNMSLSLQSGALASLDTVKQFFILNERLGIGVAEVGNLYRLSTLTGESFKKTTDFIVGQVLELQAATNTSIKYADVMTDIGSAGAATLLTVQKFAGGIANAAFQARKFGLTLALTESIGGNLLDFQSSISNELEAELLLGKQLNLQKAREAALRGDSVTLSEEIAKNIGSAADLDKLNIVQQEAYAKALGMSRNELAGIVLQREALVKLEKERGISLVGKSLKEQIEVMIADEKKSKPGISDDQARQLALEKLGQQQLAQQFKAETAAKQLQNAVGKVGESLAILVAGLTGNTNPLASIAHGVQSIFDFIDERFGNGLDELERMKRDKLVERTGIARSQATELIRQLKGPTIGERMTMGTTAGRLNVQNKRRLADRARKTIFDLPDKPKEEPKLATGGIVNKRTRVVAGEAGPEAIIPLTQLYAKLDELIAVVKTGGDVYMDGRKVGESLALGYNKL